MQVSQVLMSSDEDVNDCLLHVLCLQGLLGLVWFLSFSLTWGFSELAEGVVIMQSGLLYSEMYRWISWESNLGNWSSNGWEKKQLKLLLELYM